MPKSHDFQRSKVRRTARRAFRREISVAGVTLIALLSSAPSTSAGLLDETVGKATSSLPVAIPELPREPLPTPSVQVEAPAAPQVKLPPVKVPSVPSAPVKVPAAPSAPDQTPSGDLPAAASSPSHSVDDIAGSVKESAGTIASTPEGAGRAGGVPGLGVGRGSGSSGASPGSPSSSVPSVERGRAAPPLRWHAHVWPAVALGPFGELLTALPGSLDAIASISVADLLPRWLSGSGDTGGGGAGGQLGESAASTPSPAPPPTVPIPVGGAISLFFLIVASACLLALLVFTVRQELGALYRWWPY